MVLIVNGKAKFLESRLLKDKGITFAVFGFQEDFDRREFLVADEVLPKLPKVKDANCELTMQVLKRYDGKEDLRLVDCKFTA